MGSDGVIRGTLTHAHVQDYVGEAYNNVCSGNRSAKYATFATHQKWRN